jgi:type I restriction enzyme M protein
MSPKHPRPIDFEELLFSAMSGLKPGLTVKEHEELVLGLVFLRSLCRSFELRQAELEREAGNPRSEHYRARLADRRALAENRALYGDPIFWIPPVARWPRLALAAHGPSPGRTVDIAMAGIEQANPDLTGIFPRDYARPEVRPPALGELIELLGRFPVEGDGGASLQAFDRIRKELFGTHTLVAPRRESRVSPGLDPRAAHLIERLDVELEEARRLARDFRKRMRR